MTETRRVLVAATALSELLTAASVPHAFHGSILSSVLSNSPQTGEIFCIAEGGSTHPFRRVRDAVAGSTDFSVSHSPWTNRLHTTYRRLSSPIEIEILPAGEEGPRRLHANTVMRLHGIPFLTASEFIRAKMKAWIIRGAEHDAQDILYVLNHYWSVVDINRINEQDMNIFVSRYPGAAVPWLSIQKKYGM